MTLTIHRRTPLLLSALLLAAAAAAGAAGEPATAFDPNRVLFERYCAGCHGAHAQGGASVAHLSGPVPPALDGLSQKYGSPPPKAALLALAVDPRRPGGARICGERLGLSATGHAAWVFRRGIVLSALDYLQAVEAMKLP